MVTIRLSKNFVYDVVAHFSVHDVVALNNYYSEVMYEYHILDKNFFTGRLLKRIPRSVKLISQDCICPAARPLQRKFVIRSLQASSPR